MFSALQAFAVLALAAAPQADAPLTPPVLYRSGCPTCSATALPDAAFERFEAHVLGSTDPELPSLYAQARTAKLVGMGLAVAGVGLVVGGLFAVPKDCPTATSGVPAPANGDGCSLGVANFVVTGLGGAALVGAFYGYLGLRPSEGEFVTAVNAWNRRNPKNPFVLRLAPIPTSGSGASPTQVVSTASGAPLPRWTEPEVVVPGLLGMAALSFTALEWSQAAQIDAELHQPGYIYLSEARPLLERGAQHQWLARGGGAAAAILFGVTTWELLRSGSRSPPVSVTAGPQYVGVSGVLP